MVPNSLHTLLVFFFSSDGKHFITLKFIELLIQESVTTEYEFEMSFLTVNGLLTFWLLKEKGRAQTEMLKV